MSPIKAKRALATAMRFQLGVPSPNRGKKSSPANSRMWDEIYLVAQQVLKEKRP